MRIAYFDCFSGISGDMALGALVACGVSVDDLRTDLGVLGVSGWRLDADAVSRNGIAATDVTVVQTDPDPHGRHLSDIEATIGSSHLPQATKASAIDVFTALADAEAAVHGTTRDHVHFHEVGAIDAIVDIVGTCCALQRLGIDRVHCAPLPMGHGFTTCAHGRIPLPAPAVLEIVKGVPVYSVDVDGELVTPTGAALMVGLGASFGPMPAMRVQATGYGAGKKSFGERPNVLRVVIGEAVEESFAGASEVVALETNLDDFSPQFYDLVSERLFSEGALDVFTAPIQMKKGRPATLLTVLAAPDRAKALADRLFRETTTLGVRISTMRRICIDREWETVQTAYGPIRVKVGRRDGHVTTYAPEYEEVRAAAVVHDAPIKMVHQAAMTAYAQLPR